MVESTIYFDNAATSFPKPEEVYRAQNRYFRESGNPGRGTHALAYKTANAVFTARSAVAQFLGASKVERLIFTPGCTYATNMVLKGLSAGGDKAYLKSGDVVLISSLEHNAVMRPLRQLELSDKIKTLSLSYKPGQFAELNELEQTLKKVKPKLWWFSPKAAM